jgi:hypothetical protein
LQTFTGDLVINGKLTVGGVIDPTQLLLTGADKKFGATDAGPIYLAPFTDAANAVEVRKADGTTVVVSFDTSTSTTTFSGPVVVNENVCALAIHSDYAGGPLGPLDYGEICWHHDDGTNPEGPEFSVFFGTVGAAPPFGVGDRTLNFYSYYANENIFIIGDNNKIRLGPTNGQFLLPHGTDALPALTFFDGVDIDVNTGIYAPAADELGISTAGVGRVTVDSAGVVSALAGIGSTSATTGTLVVTGGVGISENVYVGVDLFVAGNASISGKLTVTGLIDPTGLLLTDGTAEPLVAGLLIWDDTANKFRVSLDGATLVDVLTVGAGLSGAGTTGKLPRWTSSSAIGDSSVTQNTGGDILVSPANGSYNRSFQVFRSDTAPTASTIEASNSVLTVGGGTAVIAAVAHSINLALITTGAVTGAFGITSGATANNTAGTITTFAGISTSVSKSSGAGLVTSMYGVRSTVLTHANVGTGYGLHVSISGGAATQYAVYATGAASFFDSLIVGGDILPQTDNTSDLGSSSFKFKDGYFAGKLTVDGLIDPSGLLLTDGTAETPVAGLVIWDAGTTKFRGCLNNVSFEELLTTASTSGVLAGTYQLATVTVDSTGRITNAYGSTGTNNYVPIFTGSGNQLSNSQIRDTGVVEINPGQVSGQGALIVYRSDIAGGAPVAVSAGFSTLSGVTPSQAICFLARAPETAIPITNHYGYYVAGVPFDAGAVITNLYGIFIASSTAGTNKYSMWSDSASAILSHAGPIQCGQLTANRILVSGTAGLIGNAAAMTNGQLLIGSTGVAPVVANLTAGTGISIVNGAGSISITASAGNFGADAALVDTNGDNATTDATASSAATTLTTTSTTYIQGATLSTGALTGTYWVFWSAEISNSSAASSADVRLQKTTATATTLGENILNVPASANFVSVGGVVELVLAGVSQTLQIQYRRTGGAGTISLRRVRIALVRKS